jgi:hypothetical protein
MPWAILIATRHGDESVLTALVRVQTLIPTGKGEQERDGFMLNKMAGE